MQVREGMSGVVLTVGPGHTLREVAKRMSERAVGAAVVLDEELPGPGIVSERDILRSIGRGRGPRRRAGRRSHERHRDRRRARLEPRARRDGDVAPAHPPPRGHRRGEVVGGALDARHHPRLDLRRRNLGDGVARRPKPRTLRSRRSRRREPRRAPRHGRERRETRWSARQAVDLAVGVPDPVDDRADQQGSRRRSRTGRPLKPPMVSAIRPAAVNAGAHDGAGHVDQLRSARGSATGRPSADVEHRQRRTSSPKIADRDAGVDQADADVSLGEPAIHRGGSIRTPGRRPSRRRAAPGRQRGEVRRSAAARDGWRSSAARRGR